MDKLTAIRQLLDEQGLSAVVVERQNNFSWLTGGRGFIGLASEAACGSVIVTKDDVVILSNNIEAHRLSLEESPGWRFKDYFWNQGDQHDKLLKELAGSNFKTDVQLEDWFYDQRTILSKEEHEVYRKAAKMVSQITEGIAKNLRPGKTELELAGELSAALWAKKIEPIVLLIAFDERVIKQRHPLPTELPLKKHAMIVVGGRYKGLFVSVTRFVHFGPPPEEIQKKIVSAATVDAKTINATRPGAVMGDIYKVICDGYAAEGFPNEERLHHQGGLTGYAPRERLALPGITDTVKENQAYAWNPSITGAKSEDTILVLAGGNEIISHTGDWPYIECEGLLRPAALIL